MTLKEMVSRAEELRLGPHGRRQRAMLFGGLTKAILWIDEIPRPWLDDCIANTHAALIKLRDQIPSDT